MVRYQHHAGWGQSLANGNRAADDEPITKSPEPIPNVQRARADGVLIPLEAIVTAYAAQQPGISMSYRIAEARPNTEIVFSNHAQGNSSIAELSKGGSTGVYEEMVSTIITTRDKITQQGDEHEFVMSGGWQGENDERSTDKTVWVAAVSKLRNDLVADLGVPVTFVFGQTSRWPSYRSDANISLAQVMAHREGIITLAGPEYQFPYRDGGDNAHHEQIGYYWAGEKVAQAWLSLDDTGAWDPVMPDFDNISVYPTHIEVPFLVPVPPLVFDSSQVPQQLNEGFRLVGTTSSITGVEILPDGVTVRVHLSDEILDPGASLTYAASGTWRGNLHDSDPLVSAIDSSGQLVAESGGTPHPLPNYAVQFSAQLSVEPGKTEVWRVTAGYMYTDEGMLKLRPTWT